MGIVGLLELWERDGTGATEVAPCGAMLVAHRSRISMVPAPHVVEIPSYHTLSFVYVVTPSWNSPSHQLRGQQFLQVAGFTFAMFLHDIIMISQAVRLANASAGT